MQHKLVREIIIPSILHKLLAVFIFFISLSAVAVQYGDFRCSVVDGKITIDEYTGLDSAVTIPGSFDGVPVNRIGNSAFIAKANLASVTIPSSVTSIGGSAFQRCSKLTAVTIPNNVTSIGTYAFDSCAVLSRATIGSSVAIIGDVAFGHCPKLTSFIIPNSVIVIGEQAFRDCTGLTSVTIGNKVDSIGGAAFYNCTGLTKLTIPSSVTSIGNGAFDSCSNLTGVYCKGNAPSGGDLNLFAGNTQVIVYYLLGTTGWGEVFGGRPSLPEKSQTITFPILPDMSYGDADFAPGATSSSGLTVTYASSNTAVATIVSGKIHVTGVGVTTITASQTGNADWSAAPPIQRTLTVYKGDQEIIFDALPGKVYGNADFAPGATAASKLAVTYASSDPSVATIVSGKIHITGVGTTTITASQAGNTKWNAALDADRELTVRKGSQVINFPALPGKGFGDADFAPGATASSKLAVIYASSDESVATIVADKIHINGVGTSNITASQPGDSEWNPADAQRLLTVAKGTPVITWGNPAAIANNTPLSDTQLNATTNVPGEYSYDPSAGSTLPMGAHTLSVIFTATDAANYNNAQKTVSLKVGKGIQTIAFDALPDNKVYGDPDFPLVAAADSGLPVTYTSSKTSVATIVNGNSIHITGAGTAIITASQKGNATWAAAVPVKQTLTVAKLEQTITFDNPLPDKVYGAADFAPGATASSGLAVAYTSSEPSVATIVSGKIHIIGCGTTTITAKQSGNANWNAAPDASQNLLVNMGTPVVTWANPAPIVFGKPLSATQLNAKANVPGKFAYDPGVSTKLNVGDNDLTVTFTPTDFKRYTDVMKTVSLTVNKVTPKLTITDLKQTYNADLRPVTVTTIPAGLAVDITYDGNLDAPTDVGSYAVAATVNDPNAEAVTKTATLVISKGIQKITFPTLPKKLYVDDGYLLDASASSGLDVTYTSSNPSVATIDGNNISVIGAGTTSITASQPGNNSWNAAPAVRQTLTAVKKIQTIVFDPFPFHFTVGAPDFDPGAMADSGLPVIYTSSKSAVATIVNGNIHIVGAGTTTITAKQPGDASFSAAPSVNRTLTVDNPVAGLLAAKDGNAKLKDAPVLSEDQEISDFYAVIKGCVEMHDREGLLSLFSPDYVHQGLDVNGIGCSDFIAFIDCVQIFSCSVSEIERTGDEAKVSGQFNITFNDGENPYIWTEPDTTAESPGFGYLRKTTDGWRVIGDRERAIVQVIPGHLSTADGDRYFLRMQARSSLATIIKVSGSGIQETVLQSDLESGNYTADAGEFNTLSDLPPAGTPYTFEIDYADGSHETINAFITDMPEDIL